MDGTLLPIVIYFKRKLRTIAFLKNNQKFKNFVFILKIEKKIISQFSMKKKIKIECSVHFYKSPCNRGLYNQMGVSPSSPYIMSPTVENRKIYAFSDILHIAKNLCFTIMDRAALMPSGKDILRFYNLST